MPEDLTTIRKRVYQPEGGDLMTKQSQALETDVNAIVARHIAHNIPLPVDGRPARYGDFASGMDFHEAMNRVAEAEQSFENLPAHVRLHCHNDPGEFLDLVFNPDRADELVKLKLLPEQTPQPPAAPAPAEPAPEPDPEP